MLVIVIGFSVMFSIFMVAVFADVCIGMLKDPLVDIAVEPTEFSPAPIILPLKLNVCSSLKTGVILISK